jgi:hypothetical protein
MSDRAMGLFKKYVVTRTDNSDQPGGKHDGCRYFVLDLTHDKHALPAIAAYARSARLDGYNALADDLDGILASHEHLATETIAPVSKAHLRARMYAVSHRNRTGEWPPIKTIRAQAKVGTGTAWRALNAVKVFQLENKVT